MLNFEGEEGKKTLEKVLDMAKYLGENYNDVFSLYNDERMKVMSWMPSLSIEALNNVLYFQRRAIERVRERYEEKIMRLIGETGNVHKDMDYE